MRRPYDWFSERCPRGLWRVRNGQGCIFPSGRFCGASGDLALVFHLWFLFRDILISGPSGCPPLCWGPAPSFQLSLIVRSL